MGRKEHDISKFVNKYNSLNNPEKEVVLLDALSKLNALPEVDKNLVV